VPKLINIDNGGTLTDILVVDGKNTWRTKTLTTPHDLSKCLMDGLTKASSVIYGHEDLTALLLSTDYLRYSTTQGTNALVERKGPRLGIIHNDEISIDELRTANPELFDIIVGERTVEIRTQTDESYSSGVRAVSSLSSAGANRIVVVFGGDNRITREKSLRKVLLHAFPAHLLGAVPILFSHEVAGDENDGRRAWSGVFNAFLHPEMERFLYSAEQKLREAKAQNPLLIFRNDGQSSRVAKTVAVKTYSSGPRGGAEGARELATHYGFEHLLSVDVGGTTSDVSIVERGTPRSSRYGKIENTITSFPLLNVNSFGVGGSSIIQIDKGKIKVGPESVGSLPGPACFGLGGKNATITDAMFVAGLLDSETYFGGEIAIDCARAKEAVMNAVGTPLGLELEAAVGAMEDAWTSAVANGALAYTNIDKSTVLAAFGGAGPLLVCSIAEKLDIHRILIPKLAAVFSAFGMGFSDVGHDYEIPIDRTDTETVQAAINTLLERANRGMSAENIDPDECRKTVSLIITENGRETVLPIEDENVSHDSGKQANYAVRLNITKTLPRPELSGEFSDDVRPAKSAESRTVLIDGKFTDIPLYTTANLKPESGAGGPAVLEEEFFTCKINAGWQFSVNDAGDILISRE